MTLANRRWTRAARKGLVHRQKVAPKFNVISAQTAYVVDTLQTALYHGLTADTAEDGIIAAVNMGEDNRYGRCCNWRDRRRTIRK